MVTLFTSVGAKTVSQSSTQGISEYDLLKEYEGKTEDQLREFGVDEETIQQLFNLQETIKEYSTYSKAKQIALKILFIKTL